MTETTSTATPGTIEHVGPNTPILEMNIREGVKLDDAFVSSIRQNGVRSRSSLSMRGGPGDRPCRST
ncbi:hypothetical protein [Sphingomonas sp. 66-10]|uniref:hypothetical protein n=1 Tax=Sphingomonas sp. 66-10 TaxID=1895848 RepID=UPI000B19F8F9|nr:hypothetical protein [Sphingomonas sp. 66-10]